ncbi:MAG: hypothetical protein AAB250_15335, partial [Bdellovibrionota bacterium]
IVIHSFGGSDGWPLDMLESGSGPLEIEKAELHLETALLQNPWPLPTQYQGSVKLILKFTDRETSFIIDGRGLTVEASGPGRLIHTT